MTRGRKPGPKNALKPKIRAKKVQSNYEYVEETISNKYADLKKTLEALKKVVIKLADEHISMNLASLKKSVTDKPGRKPAKAKAAGKAKSKAKAKTKAKVAVKAKPKAKSKAAVKVKSATKVKAAAKAKPKTKAKTKGAVKAKSKAKAKK